MKVCFLTAALCLSPHAFAQDAAEPSGDEEVAKEVAPEQEVAEPAAPEESPVESPPVLVGRATIQGVGGPGRRLTVYNDSDLLWTGVVVTLNDSITCRLPAVRPQDHDGILLPKCTGATTTNEQIHHIYIEANEGILDLKDLPLPAPPDEIKAWASMTFGFGPLRRLKVTNAGPEDWSECRVTINKGYHYALGDLTAGEVEGIMLGRFMDSQGVKYTANHQIKRVDVACAQGNARIRP